MERTQKRKSVFRMLIIRISILVVIFSLVQNTLILKEEIALIKSKNEVRSKRITDEVVANLKFMSSTLNAIAKNSSDIQYKIIRDFIKEAEGKSLYELNIGQLLEKMEVDTSKHHLALIVDSVIINSSSKNDIGFNLFSLLNNEEKKNFFEMSKKGKFQASSFDIEPLTRRIKIYSYYPVDENRVIQLSSYSSTADKIMQLLKRRLNEISIADDEIESIYFWLHIKKGRFPLLNDSEKELEDSLLKLVPEQKNNFSISVPSGNKEQLIDHFFIETDPSNYVLEGISLSIITDVTNQAAPVYDKIKNRVLNALLYLVLLLLIIYFATRNLKVMLSDLLKKTTLIAQGIFTERASVKGNSEFTELAEQFNTMVDKLEYSFNDIKQKNEEINAQMDEIESQRNYALEQHDIIDKQKNNMLDSINYAKQIQQATLPHEYYINEIISENFILFKPRDIVSGDFYWIKQVNQYIIIVAADSTGHGVPGAFMSMLGVSLLNDLVQQKKIVQPNLILNELRRQLKKVLRQSGKREENKDGMDLALVSINTEQNTLQFAGAFNPLILIRNNELIEYKGDKMPIGVHYNEKPSFTNHELKIEPGDTFYIYSDGFQDQMGGPKRMKFLSKNFKKLLLEIHEKSLFDQLNQLEWALNDWMKDVQQTDDILVIGFRVI